jgi:signal transduction histidine kinase
MKSARGAVSVCDVNRLPRQEGLDRIVASGLLLAAQLQLWLGHSMPHTPRPLGALVAVVVPATVAWRRRWPLAMGVVAVLATAAVFISGGQDYNIAVGIGWMCALYAIAVWTDIRGFLIGFGALTAGNVASLASPRQSVSATLQFTVIPGVAMLIARRAIRDRELEAQTHAARAELAEREHELRANQAIAEERARIARELHDLVAHNVSVMVIQAGAERHALGDGDTSTRETLGSIEQAGRQALIEARRLLGVLRRGDEREELEPQPSLAQVQFLVEQVQRAGLPVALSIEGDAVVLPAGVDLCAYRIVQEGLTNALKHAGPAHAEVVVRYATDALEVAVSDDGAGAAHANGNGTARSAGHGLIGMRERVALYGGELATGPRDGGGFAVRARLPLA